MCIFFQRSQCIHSSPQILRNDPGVRVGGIYYNLIAFVMQKLLHLLPVHSAAVKVYNGLPGCLHRFCAFRLFLHHDFPVFRCHAYRMCDPGIRQDLRQPPSFCGSRKYYDLFHSAFSPSSARYPLLVISLSPRISVSELPINTVVNILTSRSLNSRSVQVTARVPSLPIFST